MKLFTTRFLHHVTSYILVKADISTQELSNCAAQTKTTYKPREKQSIRFIATSMLGVCYLTFFVSI